MKKLICLFRGHLDVIHANSIFLDGFLETFTQHYHCERCGRLRNQTRMLTGQRPVRWNPSASSRKSLTVEEVCNV